MKRLLFFILFTFLSTVFAFPQYLTVTGTVKDTSGNPITGDEVYVYYYTNGSGTYAPVVNGGFTATLPSLGQFGVQSDSVIVEYNGCSNMHSVGVTVDSFMNSVVVPDLIIDCHPDIYVTVMGQVVDSLGLPVSYAQIETYAYPAVMSTMADAGGKFSFDIYMPTIEDSLLTLRVYDKCGKAYYKQVVLHYPDTTFATINVGCGFFPRVVINGTLHDTQGRNFFDVIVWGQVAGDTNKYMSVVQDSNFVLEVPEPSAGSTINIWVDEVNDSLGTKAATSAVTFDGVNYVYSTVINIDPNYDPVQMIYISGSARDSKNNPAPGIKVRVWYNSNPSHQSGTFTDSTGYYSINLPGVPSTNDSIIIQATDDCGNTYTLGTHYYHYQTFYDYMDFNNIACPGKPPLLEISGIVKDRAGHPVSGIKVYAIIGGQGSSNLVKGFGMDTTGNPLSCFTNDYGYYKIVFPAPVSSPMNIVVIAEDKCGHQFTNSFTYNYPNLVYQHIDFTVRCSEEDMYTWEGLVKDAQGNPLPGVQIYGYPRSDSTHGIVGVTDIKGHYLIKAGEAMDSLIIVNVTDGCNNKLRDTILFNPDQYHYVRNYVMQCAGPVPDTVVTFIGHITDTQGNVVDNQLIMVTMLDTLSMDSVTMATVTDDKGFYSISLPLPERNMIAHVHLFDACGNLYEKFDNFDFTRYVFTNDFQISCPPNYAPMQPRLAVGYEPDWQDYNTFNFFITVENMPDSLISFYVWKLAFDTIATPEPTVTYTFPAMDTCFNVGVKVVTKDNRVMKSPLLKICVKDPFGELNKKCYADFIVTRDNPKQNLFSFIPFIQSRPGWLAYEAVWDFGDGNTVTLVPPDTLDNPVRHQFTSRGIYDVTYTVTFQDTSGNSCVASWTDPVWVGHDVWYPDSCAAVFYVVLDSTNYRRIHFEDISYPGDSAQIDYYYWDLGDGNIDYAPSPTHVYDTAGMYDVTMQIITNTGCVDERQVTVQVRQGLEPLFFFPDTVFFKAGKGYGVKYRNISKSKNDKWGWDFGDAEKSSLKTSSDTVIHYYADTGVYKVTLTNLTTGASVSMNVHVKSSTEVEPLDVTLTPGQQAALVGDVYDFEKLTIYPNPVKDELTVMLPDRSDQVKIDIINLKGQIVKTVYAYGTDQLRLSVKDLSSGTYILRTQRENKIGLARFIKQ